MKGHTVSLYMAILSLAMLLADDAKAVVPLSSDQAPVPEVTWNMIDHGTCYNSNIRYDYNHDLYMCVITNPIGEVLVQAYVYGSGTCTDEVYGDLQEQARLGGHNQAWVEEKFHNNCALSCKSEYCPPVGGDDA